MRTQLILTTAAIGLAGSLGASAQVYSVNAVGYINISVPAKQFALTANQLNAGGNTVKEVFNLGDGSATVFAYDTAKGYLQYTYDFGSWSPDDKGVVAPGQGFFIQNNGDAALTVTFVGEVPQGSPLKTSVNKGVNLLASQVPQAGLLVTDLKFPAAEQDTIYQWDVKAQNYKGANAFNFGAWDNGEPTIAVGEGFWLIRSEATSSWDRTFSVNP